MAEDLEAKAELRDAERMKFFTDAVVAIAMTLLILPLLESVADAKGEHLTTAEFLSDHSSQLVSSSSPSSSSRSSGPPTSGSSDGSASGRGP